MLQGVGNGGAYYKGTVMSVEDSLGDDEYDPWESITVLWDNDDEDREQKVCVRGGGIAGAQEHGACVVHAALWTNQT